MSATTPTDPAKCAYALGEDGLASWDRVHADAWIGLLETHKRLTRALETKSAVEQQTLGLVNRVR